MKKLKELADQLIQTIGDDYMTFCKKTLHNMEVYENFELGTMSVSASGANILIKFNEYITTVRLAHNIFYLEFNTTWLFDRNKLKGLDGRPGMETNNIMTMARLRILSAIWQILDEKNAWLESQYDSDYREVNIFVNEDGSMHWWLGKHLDYE